VHHACDTFFLAGGASVPPPLLLLRPVSNIAYT